MYSSTKAIIFALFFILSANTFAKNSNQEICLAKTIYYEARGTSVHEQKDIGKIVINRSKHKEFPKTICGVVDQKNQFKWRNKETPIKDKKSWKQAQEIAKDLIRNPNLSPLSNNVLYFKSKKSKNFLTNNLIQVKIESKRTHNFYELKG